MQRTKKRALATGAVLLVAGASGLLAHHVCQPLSSILGSNILASVPFYTQTASFGVPAHRLSTQEFDHGDTIALQDGASFQVQNGAGMTESITFSASDFPDISQAEVEEVAAVISAKSQLLEASVTNAYVVMRGIQGGAAAAIQLADGVGTPLAKLTVPEGTSTGASEVVLDISIPAPLCNHPNMPAGPVAGFPYRVLVSQNLGSSTYFGATTPLALTKVSRDFLRIAAGGHMPGFLDVLDANEDGLATLPGFVLDRYFGDQYPDKLYLAFVVMSPDQTKVEFVSNAFEVDFQ